jgi:alkylhydroperoxidase/carboxymuconolactone decarboxylase family protein YurZ
MRCSLVLLPRLHLYGDVYSSPGLDMRRKQLLACAFLAEAAMPDQLFGHALAGLRFGNSLGELEEAARLACTLGRRAPMDRDAVLRTALKTLGMVGRERVFG